MAAYTFNQLISFTRTSAATYVNSAGNIVTTPASKNLLTFTEEFDNAAWTKTNCQIVPNVDPAAATYGAELVTNGTFDSGTTGWSENANATISVVSGALRVTAIANGIAYASQAITTVPGRTYRITATYVTDAITGNAFLYAGTAAGSGNVGNLTIGSTLGAHTLYFVATGTTTYISVSNSTLGLAGEYMDFDNISVREVVGGALQAPDGTFTADTLLAQAGSSIMPRFAQTVTTVAGSLYTASYFVRPGSHTFVQIYVSNQVADWCNFTLTGSGSVQNNGSAVGAISYNAATGWYRISMTWAAGGTDRLPFIGLVPNASATWRGTGTYTGTESVFLWGAQLEAVPDANLVLGSELRGGGVVSTTGSPSPLATYNTTTGDATLNRVDGSNVSGVRIPVGGAGRTIRVSVTITATTGTVQVRGNGIAGTILGTVGSTTGTYLLYVVSDTADIYLTMSSNATTASITVNSIREITGTTGMPTDYTRNFGGLFPPRFDYDPVTLQPRGLLIEEQRTNLLLRSEEFDNASWVKASATVTANAAVSPDGTMDADKVIVNNAITLGASSAAGVRQTNSKSASAITYTYTVYMKAAEFNSAFLFMSNAATSASARASFNLSAGTASATTTVGAFTSASASITPVGNGWYRCSLTATSDTAADLRCDVFPTDTVATHGDGTSGIFVWGAQLEAASFATSYIPTAGSQVTRTADHASIVAPNFAPWYNQSEGTFVVEFDYAGGTSANNPSGRFVLVASNNSSSNLHAIYNRSGVAQSGLTSDAGVTQASPGSGTSLADATVAKAAYAYRANDFAFSLNGGGVATDTSGTVPTNMTVLGIGHTGYSSSAYLNGHIRRISYYPSRLSNAQIQALTA